MRWLGVLLVGLLAVGLYGLVGSLLPTSVVVEWATANEVNTAGFNVYRSQRRDGPYVKLNSKLLPAASDPLAGGKYRYEDASVAPGVTYYYRVEDVEYSGASVQHGPIVVSAPSPWDLANLAPLALVLGAGILLLLGARVYWARGKPACG